MSLRKLFGTDGIRGVAGQPPLDPETISKIGGALAVFCLKAHSDPRVLLGRDTRASGPWISAQLTDSMLGAGIGLVRDVGVISTPGLAFLARRHQFDLGVMISASHNPFEDNGIKIFGPDGFKLSDTQELEVEALIGVTEAKPLRNLGNRPLATSLVNEYAEFLENQVSLELPLKIGLDVCHGAAYLIAPKIFCDLGASVEVVNNKPDGMNINRDCGSLYMEQLISLVSEKKLDIGVAFDGDADRSLFVTPSGRIFDGDSVLYALALHRQSIGSLRSDQIVGTIMSNCALEQALNQRGIEFLRAQVGDRYVLEMMKQTNAYLGGEPSGHVIQLDCHTAGDGILTALKLAELLVRSNASLDTLVEGFRPYPQVLDGLSVLQKVSLESPAIAALIRDAESQIGSSGRLVIRYSGTEPVLRIMAEGPDGHQVRKVVSQLKSGLAVLLPIAKGSE